MNTEAEVRARAELAANELLAELGLDNSTNNPPNDGQVVKKS